MAYQVAIGWVRVLAVGVLLVCAGPGRLDAQDADAFAADEAVLQEGVVVGLEELPTDDFGKPVLDGFPGVIPQREVSQRARREIEPLIEEAGRVLASGRAARERVEIGDVPGDAGAPARMDSTDSDPDRLRPESQPPVPGL